MESERLEGLLRQTATAGARAPLSPDCLGVEAILGLIDRPQDARSEDVQHLTACGYCQWAVALARREREAIEAPLTEVTPAPVFAEQEAAPPRGAAPDAAQTRTIKLSRWLMRWPAGMGMAAVLVAAVGLGWWLTQERDLLGPVTGSFVWGNVTRADTLPDRQYRVTFELRTEAYLTWLYLDHRRKLQPPLDATQRAERFPAGERSYSVTVTDDPPGPQWIAAVASDEPFDTAPLCHDLQQIIGRQPEGVAFETLIEQLEQALQERPGLSLRSHRFEVPAPEDP